MHSFDIIGYTFAADLHCPACIVVEVCNARNVGHPTQMES